MTATETDGERRFTGVRRLYGEAAETRFLAARVCVVGVGGVGSWVVEGLARSRIGHLTLIDLDMVAESNTNRQIQALTGEYGKAKVDALSARIRAIHPALDVRVIEDFITPENVATLIEPDLSLVIDAIDETRPKAALIAHCRELGVPIVTTGAAGGKFDPTRIVRGDLAEVEHDPLLAKTRAILRREYGFPAGGSPKKPGKKFGVPAIFSRESMRRPEEADTCATRRDVGMRGLSCTGYGSSVCVTASMGFAACAVALERLSRP
ncbi:MAG: tRNA threonylcarbamoyladenosine dehydratase [Zoogloeaceae bacterium]|jgi:tRNA A37 threonylcarbamoyladenosine dehydratase|nr:tRNA threonylcarbamoyladenosine dehydratase [Zoogloeaceae bacterium]